MLNIHNAILEFSQGKPENLYNINEAIHKNNSSDECLIYNHNFYLDERNHLLPIAISILKNTTPSKTNFSKLLKLFNNENLSTLERDFLYKSGFCDSDGAITELGTCKSIECLSLKDQLSTLKLEPAELPLKNLDIKDKKLEIELKVANYLKGNNLATHFEGGIFSLILSAYCELAYKNIMSLEFIEDDKYQWSKKRVRTSKFLRTYEEKFVRFENTNYSSENGFGYYRPISFASNGYQFKSNSFPPKIEKLSFSEHEDVKKQFKLVVHETESKNVIDMAKKIRSEFTHRGFYNRSFRNISPRKMNQYIKTFFDSLGDEAIKDIIISGFNIGYSFDSGFPDITIIKNGSLELIEVKTKDKLRFSQIDFIRNVLPKISKHVISFKVLKVVE